MARVQRTEVTVRSDRECSACSDPIVKGSKALVVSWFRHRAYYDLKCRASAEAVKGPQSRSDRAGDAATSLNDAAIELRECGEEATELSEKLSTIEENGGEAGEELRSEIAALATRVSGIAFDTSEVESLAEEMRSWADNTEEYFGSTSKHEEVEEAASTLEGIEAPEVPSLEGSADADALSSFADEAESAASDAESAASEVEDVSFPGMF